MSNNLLVIIGCIVAFFGILIVSADVFYWFCLKIVVFLCIAASIVPMAKYVSDTIMNKN